MRPVIIAALAFAFAACDANASRQTAADNTARNERDQNPNTLTPGDQGENEVDRTITQQIRQQVVAHDALGMAAANIKIITVDRVVTLRGPVPDVQQRATIIAIAQRVPNVQRVENQLEVAAN